MSPTVTAILVALPPLMIALTAWLRAETANKRIKGKGIDKAAPYGYRDDGTPRTKNG